MRTLTRLDKINGLLSEMQDMLLLAGVQKNQINIRTQAPKPDTLMAAFDWLHDLKMSHAFSDLVEAWDLLPEETWRRYEVFEIVGLREQSILEDAKSALLAAWRTNRPRLFGTPKPTPSKFNC